MCLQKACPKRVPAHTSGPAGVRPRGGPAPSHKPASPARRPSDLAEGKASLPEGPPSAAPSPAPRPSLPFRRKKDMAGPGSGRRARGDCRGEGPAPFIQQPARTSGSAAAAALARKETRLPGVGPAASSRRAGSSRRHVTKPPARSSGPSPRGASREAARRPRPPPRLLASSRGWASSRGGARARAAHGTRALPAPGPGPRASPVPGRCEGGPWQAPDPAECGPLPALPGIGPWRGSRDADWVLGCRLEAPSVPATSAVEEVRWAYYKTRSALKGQQHKNLASIYRADSKEHPSNLLQMPFS